MVPIHPAMKDVRDVLAMGQKILNSEIVHDAMRFYRVDGVASLGDRDFCALVEKISKTDPDLRIDFGRAVQWEDHYGIESALCHMHATMQDEVRRYYISFEAPSPSAAFTLNDIARGKEHPGDGLRL